MLNNFDIDAQRGLICAFGMVALTGEAVAFYLTGQSLPGEMTGAFVTMVIGPVVTSGVEKARERKREERQEEAWLAGHLDRPPSSLRPPEDGRDEK